MSDTPAMPGDPREILDRPSYFEIEADVDMTLVRMKRIQRRIQRRMTRRLVKLARAASRAGL